MTGDLPQVFAVAPGIERSAHETGEPVADVEKGLFLLAERAAPQLQDERRGQNEIFQFDERPDYGQVPGIGPGEVLPDESGKLMRQLAQDRPQFGIEPIPHFPEAPIFGPVHEILRRRRPTQHRNVRRHARFDHLTGQVGAFPSRGNAEKLFIGVGTIKIEQFLTPRDFAFGRPGQAPYLTDAAVKPLLQGIVQGATMQAVGQFPGSDVQDVVIKRV
ncbi:hypothetical protein DSECCO2_616950 [anaerobic digester metagenome]